jgi:hypothetical protein
MAPLLDITAERERPEPFPALDDTMPVDDFDLWCDDDVDDVAHISQQFARVAFGIDTDLVPL